MFPTNTQKMKFKTADQVLSWSVASGIRLLDRANKFNCKSNAANAAPTANFIEKMNNLFDILNVKSSFGSTSPYKKPLTKNGSSENLLQELKAYITNIQTIPLENKKRAPKVYAIDGIILTIN